MYQGGWVGGWVGVGKVVFYLIKKRRIRLGFNFLYRSCPSESMTKVILVLAVGINCTATFKEKKNHISNV